MPITREHLDNWFVYHPPKAGDETNRCEHIRKQALHLAYIILELTPASADQSDAIRKLREVVSTAIDAIVCEEGTPE